jgi:hypothetical protein
MYFSVDNLIAIVVACIAAFGIITAALIPLLFSIRKNAQISAHKATESLAAVINDHSKPLREDLDDKFIGIEAAIFDSLKKLTVRLTRMDHKQDKMDSQITSLFRSNSDLSNEIQTSIQKYHPVIIEGEKNNE